MLPGIIDVTRITGAHVTGSPTSWQTANGDPAVLAAMAKTFADQMTATAEAKAQADAKAAELAAKLGFTSAALGEFFKILGEQGCTGRENSNTPN
jgi:hypothetical protein